MKRSRSLQHYFAGKSVWIIGASSGIGAELALQLAQCGARLLISARNEELLAAVAEQCQAVGAVCDVYPLDLAAVNSNSSVCQRALSYSPTIDCIIFSAAVSQRAHFAEMQTDTITHIMQTNLIAEMLIAHEALRALFANRAGHIVCIGSIAGYIATTLRSVYSASKAALHTFADTLALETAGHNIRVQLVVPGFINTQISCHALDARGERYAKMDTNQEKGMEVATCATKILLFMLTHAYMIKVGWGIRGYSALFLRSCFPALLRKLLTKRAIT